MTSLAFPPVGKVAPKETDEGKCKTQKSVRKAVFSNPLPTIFSIKRKAPFRVLGITVVRTETHTAALS